MKIGITCYPTFGGSGVVATELGKALAARGHEVHFIAYALPMRLTDRFAEHIHFHEVEVPNYPLFRYPMYSMTLASKMVEVVKQHGLDLLHVHYAIPHATSAYLAKQILNGAAPDLKIVTTLHGTDITLVGMDPSFGPVVRFSIEQSDGITAVSEYLRQTTLENFPMDRPIEVIPNFVDLQRFKPKGACSGFRRSVAPNGEHILVHVSNFRPVKRAGDAVRVLAKLRESLPAKLVMVGDGPDRLEVEALGRDLGVSQHVVYLGNQDEVETILPECDLFVLPSGSETFGLAALEAMACALPVLSSDIGGLPELNVHGETGFLAPLGETDLMAAYALDMLRDPARLAVFRRAARARAEQFDLDRIVPAYEAYYARILAAAPVIA